MTAFFRTVTKYAHGEQLCSARALPCRIQRVSTLVPQVARGTAPPLCMKGMVEIFLCVRCAARSSICGRCLTPRCDFRRVTRQVWRNVGRALKTKAHTNSSYFGECRSYRACTISTFGVILLRRRQESARNFISFCTRCRAGMAMPTTFETPFSGLFLGHRLIVSR